MPFMSGQLIFDMLIILRELLRIDFA